MTSGSGSIARRRLLFWSLPAVLLVAVFVYAFRTPPELVDLGAVERRPLVVTVDEEGETRVHDVFTVSAPIAGRLLRTELHVGDPVVAGATVVARIEPADPGLLDPRARAQAEAAVRAAEAAARLSVAEHERAQADEAFAAAEVVRMRELRARGVVSQQAIDEAERAHRAARAALAAAEAAIRVRENELEVARAALIAPTDVTARTGCGCVDVRAPVSGHVLAIAEKSETVVQVGTRLLELGDLTTLEVVADYLSTDAVRLEVGQRAIVEGWGGPPLDAVVERIEPSAFTKVSALGIEEQRVNVVLDLTDPRERWATLGHGYRVDARVVVWESEEVDVVPLTALFRRGDGWAVFVADDDTARLREVDVGHRAGLDVEVRAGLVAGDVVVLNPTEGIEDSARIVPRRAR